MCPQWLFKPAGQMVLPFIEKVRHRAAAVLGQRKAVRRKPSREPLVFIDNIGPIRFIRRKRSRHIKISVEPFKGVRVTVPYGVAFKDAAAFVEEKRTWIKKQAMWVAEREREYAEQLRTAVPFDHTLAQAELTSRVYELSARFDLPFAKVAIRKQRTRWGSCSHKNNINLNMQLARLPAELRDYVILHELVHTRVKNHSALFWSTLNTLVGDAKALDRQLRKYHTWVL
ncbi:MAG: DUF45 domain-containing protein [Candidatus Omnitrophica bacterium]|nr:DUF45 domain-containing protein [Candidatus Omnitrophota bacterium]